MNKESYNKEQHQLVKSFRDTTGASEKQAITFLNRAKWNIQNAINIFFDEGTQPEKETLKGTVKIEQLFYELSSPSDKSPNVRYMDEDKFGQFNQRYFKYAQDNVVLGYILINIMGVETSGYIEYSHFLRLFEHLKQLAFLRRVTDPSDLPKYASKLEYDLKNDPYAFKQLYTKIYKFYLIGNKDLSLEYALAEQLWIIYLKPIMPLYNEFLRYLEKKTNKPTRVHRDLWNMVFQFATTVKDVATVTELDGWPVFLDEFVQFCKQK